MEYDEEIACFLEELMERDALERRHYLDSSDEV